MTTKDGVGKCRVSAAILKKKGDDVGVLEISCGCIGDEVLALALALILLPVRVRKGLRCAQGIPPLEVTPSHKHT